MTTMRAIAPISPEQQHRQPSGGGTYLLIWLFVVVVATLGLFGGWQFWHSDRIFSGVRVAGIPVGGETRAAALLRLNKELTPYPLAPVILEHEGRQWALGTESLMPAVDLEDAVQRAYFVGRRGPLLARGIEQWQAFGGRQTIWPQIEVSAGAARQAVGKAASEVRRPSRYAIEVGDLSLPARAGLDVDVGATAQLALAQAESGLSGTVPLQTYVIAPPESPLGDGPQQDARANGEAADSPTGGTGHAQAGPVVLRHEPSGISYALDTAQLERIMPGGDPQHLNEDALRVVLEGWAKQISYPAQDARLRFNDATGGLTVLQPSRPGQRMNVDLTVEAVRSALATDERTGLLPIIAVQPAVDSGRLDELGIRELIAAGTTHFGGSSAARVHNIEVAAEKLVGVVVPPGDVFSFNSAIQAVSGANGFEDSAIIWGDRTAVGVGGGVCQVSTTVFRAALEAGFPFLERHNHGYVVSWYGDPGFDATIYTPYVDLRFLNDTESHLLIQPVVDSAAGVLSFRFYGTKTDREVVIEEAEIKDRRRPGLPVYQEDPSLATGEQVQVEWPKEGLTATVIRKVTQNGKSREDRIVSVYRPWRAMILYGPGTVIPGVTDVVAPTATPSGSSEGGDES